MSVHHRYSPSKLQRIISCPGSVRLGDECPEPETSIHAEEGTLLHAHMEEAMDLWPDPYVPDTEVPEHRRLILACLQEVQAVMDGMDGDYTILNNQSVAMRDIDCEGTLDLALYNKRELHVIDFKFGGGVEVLVDNNPQLMAYADGALAIVEQIHKDWDGEVWLHIFQPRLDQYPMAQLFEEDLERFRRRLQQTIKLAESKNPPIHPGAEQCRWCPAGGACKARHTNAYNSAVTAFEAVADDLSVKDQFMSVEQLAKILKTRKQVEAAFANIEIYLLNQLKRSVEVPGFKLVSGRSSRKWKENVDAFLLSEQLGMDDIDFLETKLRSPAQVEKLLDKEGKETLREFYDTVEGPLSMVSADSSKKEISGSAKHAFRDVIDDSNERGVTSRVPLD